MIPNNLCISIGLELSVEFIDFNKESQPCNKKIILLSSCSRKYLGS